MSEAVVVISSVLVAFGGVYSYRCVLASSRFWDKAADSLRLQRVIIDQLKKESATRNEMLREVSALIGQTQAELEMKVAKRLKEEKRAEMRVRQAEAFDPPLKGIVYKQTDVLRKSPDPTPKECQ